MDGNGRATGNPPCGKRRVQAGRRRLKPLMSQKKIFVFRRELTAGHIGCGAPMGGRGGAGVFQNETERSLSARSQGVELMSFSDSLSLRQSVV